MPRPLWRPSWNKDRPTLLTTSPALSILLNKRQPNLKISHSLKVPLAIKISVVRNRALWCYWLLPVAWVAAILAMSGTAGAASNTLPLLQWLLSWFQPLDQKTVTAIHFYLRKTGHVTAYGILYFLWFRALRAGARLSVWRSFLAALAFCLLVATLDEGHQSLFQSRGSSIWDVALDMSGSGLAALLTALVWRLPARKRLAAAARKG
jgi:VanZ family protein